MFVCICVCVVCFLYQKNDDKFPWRDKRRSEGFVPVKLLEDYYAKYISNVKLTTSIQELKYNVVYIIGICIK